MKIGKRMARRLAAVLAVSLALVVMLGAAAPALAYTIGEENNTVVVLDETGGTTEETMNSEEEDEKQETEDPKQEDKTEPSEDDEEADNDRDGEEATVSEDTIEEDELDPDEDEPALLSGGAMFDGEFEGILPMLAEIEDLPGGTAANPVTTGAQLTEIWQAIFESKAPGTIYLQAGTIQMDERLYMTCDSQAGVKTYMDVTFVGVGGEAVLQAVNASDIRTGSHIYTNLSISNGAIMPMFLDLAFENVVLKGNGAGSGGIFATNTSVNITGAKFEDCARGVVAELDGSIKNNPEYYLNVQDCDFVRCVMAVGARGEMLVENCYFEDNQEVTNPYGNIPCIYVDISNWVDNGNIQIIVRGSTFINNSAMTVARDDGYEGGAIAAYGSGLGEKVVIEDCQFIGNEAYAGGAVCLAYFDDIIIRECTFTDNNAVEDAGGGLLARADSANSSILLESNTFTGNSAELYGGGAYIRDFASVIIRNSPFSSNTAYEEGGGLFVIDRLDAGTEVLIESTDFTGNQANNGGGLLAQVETLEMRGGTLTENEAWADGGAMVGVNGDFVLKNVAMPGNIAGRYGGAIYADGTRLDITGGSISDNGAAGNGGGIYSWYYSDITLNGVTLENNTVTQGDGGAVYITPWDDGDEDEIASLVITGGSKFTGNKTLRGRGGAIYMNTGNFASDGTVYTNNSSTTSGGAMYLGYGDTASITSDDFSQNTSGQGGAVYIAYVKDVSIDGGDYTENKATNDAYGGGAMSLYGHDTAALNDLTFIGNEGYTGGALSTSMIKDLQILDSSFISNIAYTNGGAHASQGDPKTTIDNCLFEGNEAQAKTGGALYYWDISYSTETFITGTTFKGNHAAQSGGAAIHSTIAPILSELTIEDCEYEGNTAGTKGGALYLVRQEDVAISNTTFDGNEAEEDGGAVHGGNVYLTATDVIFTGNVAGANGGAILSDGTSRGTFSLALKGDTLLTGNKALSGGAVYVKYVFLDTVSAGPDVEFSANEAAKGYTMLDSDADMHAAQILGSKFTAMGYAYNNYDIGYTRGTEITGFAVVYDPNGGTGTAFTDALTPPEAMGYEILDADHSNLGFTREGHGFLGWSTDPDATEAETVYTPGNNINVMGELELYAIWQTKSYKVTFDPATAGQSTFEQMVLFGKLVQEPTAPTRTGYTFRGWFGEDGQRWIFTDDVQNSLTAMTMPAKDIKLTARWQINTYTLTFKLNNGASDLVYQVDFGSAYDRPADPTYSGHVFTGWYDASGNRWDANSGIMPAGPVTYSARWQKEETPPPSTSSTPEPEESSSQSSRKPGNPGPDPTTTTSTTTSWVVSSSSSSSAASSSSEGASTGSEAVQAVSETESSESQSVQQEESALPEVVEILPGEEDNGTFNLFGNEIPMGGFGASDGWSGANLLLALIAFANAVFLLVRLVMRRRRQPDDAEFLSSKNSGNLILTILVAVTGILPLVLLPVLENIGLGMMLFSRWTPLYIAASAASVALAIVQNLLAKHKA